MFQNYSRWEYTDFDHRGHWVELRDHQAQLSMAASKGAYERERDAEYMSEEYMEQTDAIYPLLRISRATGCFDGEEDRQEYAAKYKRPIELIEKGIPIVADACRAEGIPVLQDYPFSMREAIKSYGGLLSSLYAMRASTFSHSGWLEKMESLYVGEVDRGAVWQSKLGVALNVLSIARSVKAGRYDILEESVSADVLRINETVQEFNEAAHHYPHLLQSFWTLATHLGIEIPSAYPVQPITVPLWKQFDVCSSNFLNSISSQPDLLHNVSGHQFEKIVAELFRKDGFEVVRTKQSRDGGVDLFLVASLSSKIKAKYLVECKNPRRGKPVGVSVVRGLRGVSDHKRFGSAGGVLVTTTEFTKDARKEAAASGWEITLYDRNDLLEMIEAQKR